MADQATSAPVEICTGFGNPDSVKRSLRRERARYMPKNPTSLSDLTLDGEWTTTIDGDQFLLHDSGEESESRMLVFGTEQGLRRLASSDSWFMDGTFDVTPLLFTQLYRVPLGESAVTCVYVFLPNKNQATYEEFFTAIQDKCHSLGFDVDPVTVTVKFLTVSDKCSEIILWHPSQYLRMVPSSDAVHLEEDPKPWSCAMLPPRGRCQAVLWHVRRPCFPARGQSNIGYGFSP